MFGVMPDGLNQHASDHALWRPLHQLESEATAYAVAQAKAFQGSVAGIGPADSPPLAFLWSMVMQRNSSLKISIALKTEVGQLAIREFNPPPGVSSSGNPLPASS